MADTQNTKVQEQDIHQLLKVKREKLANLQEAGELFEEEVKQLA